MFGETRVASFHRNSRDFELLLFVTESFRQKKREKKKIERLEIEIKKIVHCRSHVYDFWYSEIIGVSRTKDIVYEKMEMNHASRWR